MRVVEDIVDLRKAFPLFENHDCVVIIARYDFGKSSVCTELIHEYFGEDKTYYATFIDQSKPGFTPRKSRLVFGQLVKDKVVVFDEISDDKDRDVRAYLKSLMGKNKVIILSNPYALTSNPTYECELFSRKENDVLPKDTLFVWVSRPLYSK
jgi:hypothetical protein